jgi:hypothetical protein
MPYSPIHKAVPGEVVAINRAPKPLSHLSVSQQLGRFAMKRAGLWATAVVLLVGTGVLTGGAGYAQDAETSSKATCSVATLRGTYLFALQGISIRGNDRILFAAAGYEVYNGRGNVDLVASLSENGQVVRNLRRSGPYTVNRDCTGTASYADPTEHYDLFVAPDGGMFTFIQTDPGIVLSAFELRGTAKRVGG